MSTPGDEFKVHRLNAAGLSGADSIAKAFDRALAEVRLIAERTNDKCNARELALVVTTLQTASFWAKRAMALLPEYQEDES